MGDYPNSDEEFELQYGDELELLNEQDDLDEPDVRIPYESSSRRSLNYENSTKKSCFETQSDLFSSQSHKSTDNRDKATALDNSFDQSFQLIPDESESTSLINQNDTVLADKKLPESQPPKKRTIEELFGDIDDLIFENERHLKRLKPTSKLEEQMEMIDKILELRKQKKDAGNILFHKKAPLTAEERNKLNLSRRVPNYPFIGVTNHDREKFYVRCHSDSYEKEDIARVINDINFVGVMGDMFKETWKEAQTIINKQIDENTNKSEETEIIATDLHDDQHLWVDVYKPRRYLELLSDESTNRILLKWLKLWDKVVFHRRPKIRPVAKVEGNKSKFINHLEEQLKLDEDGRPLYKVALLCGRPGLGKTTLAHVVAKQAGYNVIEINASDDRSVEVFRTSLENATQMRSVIDQQKRPNCVIFDEIDGAPTQSIEFLVKFVSGTVSRGKKKEKNTMILKRPIICICNDAYVPALRSLRQMAFVVNFPPTSSGRLSERLMEISRWQQLNTDMGTMLALAEKSNNDIRSCLGILHFFKAQNKPITLSDIYNSSIGQKDMQKGLFSVWTDIFMIERAKMKFSKVEADKGDTAPVYDMSYKSRMNKILNVVQSFGDYDRLAQGVFENFPEMQIKDSSLRGTCCALDWFCYSDELNKFIMSQQNYSLSSYLPYAFVVWHFQFSSLVWQQMKYPNAGYEVRQKLAYNHATLKELVKGIPPKTKIFVNAKSLILDILSPLIRIISPPFRPVNLHLFTVQEKASLNRVVDIMIDYNLTYIQDKNASGIYEFKLDPDVLPIIMYPTLTQQSYNLLSYFNKQLISREIELGKIKKFEASSLSGKVNSAVTNKESKKRQRSPLMSPEDDKNVPNHMKRLKAKSVQKIAPAVTKDFFGRIITNPESSDTGSKGPQLDTDIWYKYKEGYSNAVRKKIKISRLL